MIYEADDIYLPLLAEQLFNQPSIHNSKACVIKMGTRL